MYFRMNELEHVLVVNIYITSGPVGPMDQVFIGIHSLVAYPPAALPEHLLAFHQVQMCLGPAQGLLCSLLLPYDTTIIIIVVNIIRIN